MSNMNGPSTVNPEARSKTRPEGAKKETDTLAGVKKLILRKTLRKLIERRLAQENISQKIDIKDGEESTSLENLLESLSQNSDGLDAKEYKELIQKLEAQISESEKEVSKSIESIRDKNKKEKVKNEVETEPTKKNDPSVEEFEHELVTLVTESDVSEQSNSPIDLLSYESLRSLEQRLVDANLEAKRLNQLANSEGEAARKEQLLKVARAAELEAKQVERAITIRKVKNVKLFQQLAEVDIPTEADEISSGINGYSEDFKKETRELRGKLNKTQNKIKVLIATKQGKQKESDPFVDKQLTRTLEMFRVMSEEYQAQIRREKNKPSEDTAEAEESLDSMNQKEQERLESLPISGPEKYRQIKKKESDLKEVLILANPNEFDYLFERAGQARAESDPTEEGDSEQDLDNYLAWLGDNKAIINEVLTEISSKSGAEPSYVSELKNYFSGAGLNIESLDKFEKLEIYALTGSIRTEISMALTNQGEEVELRSATEENADRIDELAKIYGLELAEADGQNIEKKLKQLIVKIKAERDKAWVELKASEFGQILDHDQIEQIRAINQLEFDQYRATNEPEVLINRIRQEIVARTVRGEEISMAEIQRQFHNHDLNSVFEQMDLITPESILENLENDEDPTKISAESLSERKKEVISDIIERAKSMLKNYPELNGQDHEFEQASRKLVEDGIVGLYDWANADGLSATDNQKRDFIAQALHAVAITPAEKNSEDGELTPNHEAQKLIEDLLNLRYKMYFRAESIKSNSQLVESDNTKRYGEIEPNAQMNKMLLKNIIWNFAKQKGVDLESLDLANDAQDLAKLFRDPTELAELRELLGIKSEGEQSSDTLDTSDISEIIQNNFVISAIPGGINIQVKVDEKIKAGGKLSQKQLEKQLNKLKGLLGISADANGKFYGAVIESRFSIEEEGADIPLIMTSQGATSHELAHIVEEMLQSDNASQEKRLDNYRQLGLDELVVKIINLQNLATTDKNIREFGDENYQVNLLELGLTPDNLANLSDNPQALKESLFSLSLLVNELLVQIKSEIAKADQSSDKSKQRELGFKAQFLTDTLAEQIRHIDPDDNALDVINNLIISISTQANGLNLGNEFFDTNFDTPEKRRQAIINNSKEQYLFEFTQALRKNYQDRIIDNSGITAEENHSLEVDPITGMIIEKSQRTESNSEDSDEISRAWQYSEKGNGEGRWTEMSKEDYDKLISAYEKALDQYQFAMSPDATSAQMKRINWLPMIPVVNQKSGPSYSAGKDLGIANGAPWHNAFLTEAQNEFANNDQNFEQVNRSPSGMKSFSGNLYTGFGEDDPVHYVPIRKIPLPGAERLSRGVNGAIRSTLRATGLFGMNSRDTLAGLSNTKLGDAWGLSPYDGGDPAKALGTSVFGRTAEELIKENFKGYREKYKSSGINTTGALDVLPDALREQTTNDRHQQLLKAAQESVVGAGIGEAEMIGYLEGIPSIALEIKPGEKPNFNQDLADRKLDAIAQFDFYRMATEEFSEQGIEMLNSGKFKIGGRECVVRRRGGNFEVSFNGGRKWRLLSESTVERRFGSQMNKNEGAAFYKKWKPERAIYKGERYYVHYDPYTGLPGLYNQESIDWEKYRSDNKSKNGKGRPQPLTENGRVVESRFGRRWRSPGSELRKAQLNMSANVLYQQILDVRERQIALMLKKNGTIDPTKLYSFQDLVRSVKSYEQYGAKTFPPFTEEIQINGTKQKIITIPDPENKKGIQVNYEVALELIERMEKFYLGDKIQRQAYIKKGQPERVFSQYGEKLGVATNENLRASLEGYIRILSSKNLEDGATKIFSTDLFDESNRERLIELKDNIAKRKDREKDLTAQGLNPDDIKKKIDQEFPGWKDEQSIYDNLIRLDEYESLLFGKYGMFDFDKMLIELKRQGIPEIIYLDKNNNPKSIKISDSTDELAISALKEQFRQNIKQTVLEGQKNLSNSQQGNNLDPETVLNIVTSDRVYQGEATVAQGLIDYLISGMNLNAPAIQGIPNRPNVNNAGKYNGIDDKDILTQGNTQSLIALLTSSSGGLMNSEYDQRAIVQFMEEFSNEERSLVKGLVKDNGEFYISKRKKFKADVLKMMNLQERATRDFIMYKNKKSWLEGIELFMRRATTVTLWGSIAAMLATGNPAAITLLLGSLGVSRYGTPKIKLEQDIAAERRNFAREVSMEFRQKTKQFIEQYEQGGILSDSDDLFLQELLIDMQLKGEFIFGKKKPEGWSAKKPFGLGLLETVTFGEIGVFPRLLGAGQGR